MTAERDALAAALRVPYQPSNISCDVAHSPGEECSWIADHRASALLDALHAAGWRLVSVAPTESLVNDAEGSWSASSIPGPSRSVRPDISGNKPIKPAARQPGPGFYDDPNPCEPYRKALERLVDAWDAPVHHKGLQGEEHAELDALMDEARALLTDANGVRTKGRREVGE